MSEWNEILGAILALIGSLLVVISALGILRFPDLFTRIHASGVGATLGVAFVLLGLTVYNGVDANNFKLLLLLFFLLFTSPMTSHALARAALEAGLKPLANNKNIKEIR